MRYTVVLIPDPTDGGYVAYVPAIPGCVTQGDTVDEAMHRAADAAEGLLTLMVERGDDLPVEGVGAVVSSVDVAVPEYARA